MNKWDVFNWNNFKLNIFKLKLKKIRSLVIFVVIDCDFFGQNDVDLRYSFLTIARRRYHKLSKSLKSVVNLNRKWMPHR